MLNALHTLLCQTSVSARRCREVVLTICRAASPPRDMLTCWEARDPGAEMLRLTFTRFLEEGKLEGEDC